MSLVEIHLVLGCVLVQQEVNRFNKRGEKNHRLFLSSADSPSFPLFPLSNYPFSSSFPLFMGRIFFLDREMCLLGKEGLLYLPQL